MGGSQSKNVDKCSIHYGTWVDAENGFVPTDAVIGGYDFKKYKETEEDKEVTFIGRGLIHNCLVPGKVYPRLGCCYVSYGGKEHALKNYQVLVNREDNLYQWTKASGGNIVNGAVLGGVDMATGEKFFIGRVLYKNSSFFHGYYYTAMVTGKIHPTHSKIYIPFGQYEYAYDDYEILGISSLQNEFILALPLQDGTQGPYLFAEAKHLPGFSPVQNEDQYQIISEIIAAIEFTGATSRSIGTLIRARDVSNRLETNLRRRLDNSSTLQSIRLDLQGHQNRNGLRFERHSIQIDNMTVATVHIQIGAEFGARAIRAALWQSINEEAEIWMHLQEPSWLDRGITAAAILGAYDFISRALPFSFYRKRHFR